MYIHVCMVFYTHIYIYIYTYILYIYVFTHSHIYMCIHVCMYTYIYTYLCIHIYLFIYLYIYMYVYPYTHIYVYIYIYIFIYLYVYIYICLCTYICICMYVYVSGNCHRPLCQKWRKCKKAVSSCWCRCQLILMPFILECHQFTISIHTNNICYSQSLLHFHSNLIAYRIAIHTSLPSIQYFDIYQ